MDSNAKYTLVKHLPRPEPKRMTPDTLELLRMVLDWWEEAQYWESYPGHNRFDEDPEFIKKAKEMWENFIKGKEKRDESDKV